MFENEFCLRVRSVFATVKYGRTGTYKMLLLFPGDDAARNTARYAEEKAGYGLWQVDLTTGQMECSQKTYRLLGLPPDSAAKEKPLSFSAFESAAHPDDLPALAEIHHILAEGLPFDRQFRVIHRNGRVRSLSIQGEVLVDSAGRRSRAVGVLIDITHHVEKLHASQIDLERIRALMNGIGAVMWTARSDSQFTDFILHDEATAPIPAHFLGLNWQTMLHPDDIAKTKRAWNKAVAEKSVYTVDHRVRDPGGTYKWRRSYAAPLLNDDGSIREWVGLSLHVHQQQSVAAGERSELTGAQIRAARGILNWSVRDLADRTGLSVGVVRRLEETDEAGKNAAASLNLIKDALSAGGVDFFVLPGGEAGVFPTRKANRFKIVGKIAGGK
jgi:PAS domain-containing protein